MAESKAPWEGAEMDRSHGFQRERGFVVDAVVGQIVIPVVRCHSDEHPEIAERIVVLTEDGKVRVHDYAAVARAHGHEVVGDRWMWGRASAARISTVVRRILQGLEGRALAALARVLGIR